MATYTNADLYRMVVEDAGRSTAKELAKRVGMKEPNFNSAIMKHAMESGKPLPKMAFEKSKTTVKSIRRRRKDCDIRISHFRLGNSGLGDVLAFKLVAEPDHPKGPRLVLIEDTTAPKTIRATRSIPKALQKTEDVIENEKAQIDEVIAQTTKASRSSEKPATKNGSVKVTKTTNKAAQKKTLVSK